MVALAAVLGTVTAATPAPGPLARTVVPARLEANLRVIGDVVLVAQPSSLAMPRAELSAYRLPGATPLWQVPWQGPGQLGSVQRFGDTVVAEVVGDIPGGVLALDVADGRERWRQPGMVLAVTAARQLLLVTTSVPDPTDGPILLDPSTGEVVSGPGPTDTVRLVDPATGRVRWSRTGIRNGGIWVLGGRSGAEKLALAPSAGAIELVDAESGRTVATGIRTGPAAGLMSSVLARGDLLLVTTDHGQSAFRLPGLEPVWSRPPEPVGPVFLAECGQAVCLVDHRGDLYPMDAATGQPGPRLLADRQALWRLGDKFLSEGGGLSGDGLTLVDAATGTELARFGPWHPLDPEPEAARAVLVRYGPNGRTFLGQLGSGARRIEVLTVLDDVSGDCWLHGGRVLSCRLLDGRFGLWQVPG